MTLWHVYHTTFSVIATSTVSYITPMVWYAHALHCLQWSKTIRALDSHRKVQESVQRYYLWSRVRKDCQSMNLTLTDFLIECFNMIIIKSLKCNNNLSAINIVTN